MGRLPVVLIEGSGHGDSFTPRRKDAKKTGSVFFASWRLGVRLSPVPRLQYRSNGFEGWPDAMSVMDESRHKVIPGNFIKMAGMGQNMKFAQ